MIETDRVSEFEIKLIDIDSDNLGIPDVEYDAVVKMPSREFQRICADMKMLSESGKPIFFFFGDFRPILSIIF